MRRHDSQVVGIVGLGPVGTILGAHLAAEGVEVYAVESIAPRREQVQSEGMRVRGTVEVAGKAKACFARIDELSGIQNLAAVFICTKTWGIQSVMSDLVKSKWPPAMRIIAFMNGIGPEDAIGKFVGDSGRVCRAVLNFAGNLAEDGTVTMNWFHPPNLLGPATDRRTEWAPEMTEILTRAGLTTEQASFAEIKKAAFFKTILNSALNALCAAHGLTMAEAMRMRHTRGKARVLLQEGLTVAATVGYNYGEDALESCMAYLEAGGEHYPSMWFDLKNRRPTEIDYINGKIVKIGRMFKNVDVDLNMFFTSAIITQEIKNGTRDENDIPDYLVFP